MTLTPRAIVNMLVQMCRGLGKFRDRAGRALTAILAVALFAQLSLAGFLTFAPIQTPGSGETLVICGASGVYTIAIDEVGEEAPGHASPHCPFCIVAPGLAPPAAPDCAPTRRLFVARVRAVEPILRPEPPTYASPPSRAPPAIA